MTKRERERECFDELYLSSRGLAKLLGKEMRRERDNGGNFVITHTFG